MIKHRIIQVGCLFFCLAVISIIIISRTNHGDQNQNGIANVSHIKGESILTRDALDDLITRAANQKYIQDVLSGNPKLPLSKKAIPLQPNPYNEIPPTSDQASNSSNNETTDANLQRCTYNGQTYVTGDIVKINEGWVRCTPTILFSTNNPVQEQTGNSAWTMVQ